MMFDATGKVNKNIHNSHHQFSSGKTLSCDKEDTIPKRVELSTVLDWGKGELSRLSNQGGIKTLPE